jgi:hypothetical protein
MRGSLVLALLAWTTLASAGAAYAHGWLQQRAWVLATTAPISTKQQESIRVDYSPSTYSFRSSTAREDRTALNFRLKVELDTVTDGGAVESGTVKVRLRRTGAPDDFVLEALLPDGAFTLTGPEGEIASGNRVDLNAQLVEQWYKAAGLDTGNDAVRLAMHDTLELVKVAANDPQGIHTFNSVRGGMEPGALQSGGSSSSSGPVGGGLAMAGPPIPRGRDLGVAAAVLGACYLAGCVAIVWRHRCLVTPARSPSAPTG